MRLQPSRISTVFSRPSEIALHSVVRLIPISLAASPIRKRYSELDWSGSGFPVRAASMVASWDGVAESNSLKRSSVVIVPVPFLLFLAQWKRKRTSMKTGDWWGNEEERKGPSGLLKTGLPCTGCVRGVSARVASNGPSDDLSRRRTKERAICGTHVQGASHLQLFRKCFSSAPGSHLLKGQNQDQTLHGRT